jgi:hypothetical protein
MKFKTLLVAFLVASILPSCSNNPVSNKIEEEIFYISNNGRNVDVFNITELWSSEEGVEYLNRRDFKYSEFSGRMKVCTSADYYCVVGGIAASVPKEIKGQKQWQADAWKCQAETPLLSQKSTVITCDYMGKSTRFTYSPEKGITSYYFLSDPNIRYELIGGKGLLAPK